MEKITAAKLDVDYIVAEEIEDGEQVLYNPEDGTGLQACIVDHINADDQYFLKGTFEGFTKPNPIFFKFVIQDGEQQRSVKFSHWRRILTSGAKVGDILEWKITSKPFKEGDYSGVCSSCNGWFTGAKRQPLCQDCCNELAYASLHGHEDKKTKRPRLVKPDTVMKIAKKAFEMAQLGITWENTKQVINRELKK